MKADRHMLLAVSLTLTLVGASLVGGWLLAGEEGQGWQGILDALEIRSLRNPLATAVLFVAIFAVTTTLTLPTATLLCVAAGYLFGTLAGALVALAGAVGGALLTFLAVRFIAGERIREFFLEGRTRRLIRLLERDAFFYLFVFRIVPVAPFFAINAAGAMIRISTRRYLCATTLGLAPVTLIFASLGAGIETVIQLDSVSGSEILLQPRMYVPLLALMTVVLSSMLARIALRRRSRRRSKTQTPT